MKPLSLILLSLLLAGCGTTINSQEPVTAVAKKNVEIVIDIDEKDKKTDAQQYEKLLFKASAPLKKGRYQEAINKYLNPVIAEFNKTYQNDKIRVYSARGQTDTLLYLIIDATKYVKGDLKKTDYEKTIVIASFWSKAFYLKGYVYISLGNLDEGEKWLSKAITLSPENSQFISELAYIYQTRKNYSKGLELYEKAETATTYSPDELRAVEKGRALRGAGYNLIELGRLKEAEEKYHEALKINPDDHKAKNELKYIDGLRMRMSQ